MNRYNLPVKLVKEALRQVDKELYEKHLKGDFDIGDPNNPMYNNGWNYATGKFQQIFGMSQDELLAKQYK